MSYMCTNEDCKETWSRLAGHICPKCGAKHKLGEAIEKITNKIFEESDRLDIKYNKNEQTH